MLAAADTSSGMSVEDVPAEFISKARGTQHRRAGKVAKASQLDSCKTGLAMALYIIYS